MSYYNFVVPTDAEGVLTVEAFGHNWHFRLDNYEEPTQAMVTTRCDMQDLVDRSLVALTDNDARATVNQWDENLPE